MIVVSYTHQRHRRLWSAVGNVLVTLAVTSMNNSYSIHQGVYSYSFFVVRQRLHQSVTFRFSLLPLMQRL